MKHKIIIFALCLLFNICSVYCVGTLNSNNTTTHTSLSDGISDIVSSYPGKIGVAIIINNTDTITINDRIAYPMMSVFKLHQAIALCHQFDYTGNSLDSIISISRNSLDQNTWSPMLKDHTESMITLSVRDLLRYSLIQSDNNASNLMFNKLVDVITTDRFIASLIPRHTFKIAYSEEDMSADHAKAYANHTSPLGAAMLINRLFSDSIISPEKQEFIKNTLGECMTGNDRIAAPLIGIDGVSIAHKTGSGYIDNEVLMAHNDVAYITLPNGTKYSLAIFVRDFKGNENEASKAMAEISYYVYKILSDMHE